MIYQPTLQSVRTHPLPDWYSDAKFGIFIHWGIYSVPGFAPPGSMELEKMIQGEMSFAHSPYAEWYQNSLRIPGSPTHQHHARTYGEGFRYEQFAGQFNQQIANWDPEAWAGLFARAGARYVVLVSKHHDGFLMWNSRHPNPRLAGWQAARDVAGELSAAVQARGMKMGFYYSSLLDWSFTPRPITSLPELLAGSDTSRGYRAYVENHWSELIERYDPWILWSDIGYPPGYNLAKLFAHFYNRKPEGVVNDRWMQLPGIFFNRVGRAVLAQVLKRMAVGEPPKPAHCDFVTPEYTTLDRITDHKWETCRGIGNSFGYNQAERVEDYQTAGDLIRLLADIVSKNGNLLLNVGPCADGTLHPSQMAALEGLGGWLQANGEAIYGTRPWVRFGDTDDGGGEARYTRKGDGLYAIVVRMPAGRVLGLPADVAGEFSLLETGESVPVTRSEQGVQISLPVGLAATAVPVLKIRQAAESLFGGVKIQ